MYIPKPLPYIHVKLVIWDNETFVPLRKLPMSSKSGTTNILCTIIYNDFPVLDDKMPVKHWKIGKRS